MAMGKIGIASWPFWLKTRTRIEKMKAPLSEPWDYQHLGELTQEGCYGLCQNGFECLQLEAAASRGVQSEHALTYGI